MIALLTEGAQEGIAIDIAPTASRGDKCFHVRFGLAPCAPVSGCGFNFNELPCRVLHPEDPMFVKDAVHDACHVVRKFVEWNHNPFYCHRSPR